MSLRVWLPLTKDLRQQGLNSVTATNDGAVFKATEGKLGGCYEFNGDGSAIKFPYSLANTTTFTACMWVKPTATTIVGCPFIVESSAGYWQFGAYNNNIVIRDVSTGASGTRKSYSMGSFVANQWTHIACSYNAGVIKIYRDGVLLSTNNTGGASMNDYAGTPAGISEPLITSNTAYYFSGCVNDFRIYDHCLSPQEVKQISKGLLLHYLLNRNGFGCENIFSYGSDCQTNLDNITQNTNKFTIVTEDGIKCAHAAGALTTEKKLQSKVGITPAPQETFTFSAWVKLKNITAGTTNPMCEFYFSGQTIDGAWRGVDYVDFKVDGKSVSLSSIHFYTGGWNINDSNWHYVSATCKYKNVTYTSTLYPAIYLRDCTGDLYIHHIKFERGNKATPWCPAAGDDLYDAMGLNSLIEYDVSGFGYNGTHVGSLDWSSDSPKYSASTVFDGASYIVTTPEWMTQGAEEYTISIWAYMDDWANYPGRMYSCIQTGGFCDEKSGSNLQWAIHTYSNAEQTTAAYTSGTYCTYPFASITPGWHMFTWTYTTSVIKGYIDGEVVSTKTITTYGIHFNTNALLALGAESAGATITSPYFTGNLSDFRLYATALSDKEVLSLYQNEAEIDDNNIIYGAIH